MSLTARFLLPDLLERGRAQTITCPVYDGGEVATPSAGTVQVLDRGGEVQASGAATIEDGVATYDLAADTFDGVDLDEGWQVVWSLTIDGESHVIRNEAALVAHRLYPVITDQDLYDRVGALSPTANKPLTSLSTYERYRDAAWVQIQRRLIREGRRPWLILSPGALAEPHLCLTLALIFEDISTRNAEHLAARATDYRAQFADAWRQVSFAYDLPSGTLSTGDTATNRRTSKRAPTFLASRR